jgi:hypothetical protein
MQIFTAKSNARPYDGPTSSTVGSYETSKSSTLSEINSELKRQDGLIHKAEEKKVALVKRAETSTDQLKEFRIKFHGNIISHYMKDRLLLYASIKSFRTATTLFASDLDGRRP